MLCRLSRGWGGWGPHCRGPCIQALPFGDRGTLLCHMKFVIVQITNENDILEADISASDSGLHPSKPSYHLMLGAVPRGDIVLTTQEALRRIGFAIADQLKDEEETIRQEAHGARALLLGLDEGGQVVLRFDIGVTKSAAVNALIDGGLERKRVDDGAKA
jgi:hypothetical protein